MSYSSRMTVRRHPKGTSSGKGGRFAPKAKADEHTSGQALKLAAQSRMSAIAKPFRRAKNDNSQEDSFGIRARSVLERYRPDGDARQHDRDLAELRQLGRRSSLCGKTNGKNCSTKPSTYTAHCSGMKCLNC